MNPVKRVIIFDEEGKDISDYVELVNGKSNIFGWSVADLEYKGEIIGSHYCGTFTMKGKYTHKIEDI